METRLDADGQPVVSGYNENRRINRALNELTGFLRGIIADNYVSEEETESLSKWLLVNREIQHLWPVRPLADRIWSIYEDGVVTEEERADLKDLIQQIVGGYNDEEFLLTPTTLPLTVPEPEVIFDSNEFVLTGKFLYGTRKRCEKEIEIRGGSCSDAVRLRTSYLVIGSLVSRDWKHTTFGNKIVKAAEYAERCPISIISEKRWEQFLMDGIRSAGAVGTSS
jgi:NAD-dependent DNA ligase